MVMEQPLPDSNKGDNVADFADYYNAGNVNASAPTAGAGPQGTVQGVSGKAGVQVNASLNASGMPQLIGAFVVFALALVLLHAE